MRIGQSQTNQSNAIGSTDGTNGGRLSLGYGGNATPTTLGNSTWTLQAVGTEFRLTRVTSGGASANPLAITEAGAATITGSLSCTGTITSTTSLGLLINPAAGVGVVRYSRASARRWDVGITIDTESGGNTGTNFEIVRASDAGSRIDAPLVIDRGTGRTTLSGLLLASAPTVGPLTSGGSRAIELSNSSGTVTLQTTPTANRTISIPDNDGRITLTKTVSVTNSKTLALTDIDSIQVVAHAAAAIITIPTSASVAIPVGSEIRLINTVTAHRLTIATAGITLFNHANLPMVGTDIVFVPEEAEIRFLKIATDTWIISSTEISPRLCTRFYSDCFSLDDPNAALTGAGTGNGVTASAPETGAPGILTLVTGTTATGRHALYTATTGLTLGARRIFFESKLRVSTASATGTDEFTVIAGLASSITADPQNGVFFRHTTQNSGNWQAVCVSAGSASVLNTALSATVFRTLSFLIARDGASVEFFADGASVGSLSTNLPTLGVGFSFAQIRKTLGTSDRGVVIDKYHAVFDV
jgi:hypothetical protein